MQFLERHILDRCMRTGLSIDRSGRNGSSIRPCDVRLSVSS